MSQGFVVPVNVWILTFVGVVEYVISGSVYILKEVVFGVVMFVSHFDGLLQGNPLSGRVDRHIMLNVEKLG